MKDPRIDAYISNAARFAQPILKHMRAAVHAGCPDVVETIKWGVPAFEYKGPFCGMAAFKKHVMFGFWKHKLMADRLPKGEHAAFGRFGRITSIDEVPSRTAIVKLVRFARKLNDDGVKVPRIAQRRKPPVRMPPFFMAELRKNPKALAAYEAFSPSHKREYIEYVTEAKKEETRQRRMQKTIEWLTQGKSRNWKYQG